MASKSFVAICAFAVFNVATSQVINRVLPFAPNIPLPFTETLIPNQIVVNNPLVQSCGPVPLGVDTILSSPVTVPATTTIIQDSTVANNLANALQLLIVSNLLSNTLPSMGDVVVPSCASSLDVVSPLALAGLAGLPGYSYII